ncbi:MAG: hypothetical protein QNL62_21885 [Gammaproteobacteria bacterium]|nr:hypothetical protein [Gammaproteobacteria bacterium]
MKTIITGVFLLSASVLLADDISQYGLGAEGSTHLSVNRGAVDFEKEYNGLPVDQNKENDSIAPGLKIDIDYQNKTADFTSPHHSFNTGLNHKLNNTSNEFKTRMGYRFDYLAPAASFNYSPDSYGFGKYYNYQLGVAVPVNDIFSLETSYGWNQFDKNAEQGGINNYQDWSIGVSTSYKGVKLKMDYIDINASENSEECGKTFPCEGKAVFSIIKNF